MLFRASLVLANVMAPAMWAMWWQLIVGNVLIGVVEALVISHFRPQKRAPFITMIGANYFSTFVGFNMMPLLADWLGLLLLGDVPLFTLHRVVWGLLVAGLVLSVLLEWPFVFALFRNAAKPARRSFGACFAAQAATYLLLFFAFVFGDYTLDPRRIVPVAQLSKHPEAAVLYISPTDGHIYRVRLDGSSPTKYRNLGTQDWNALLSTGGSEREGGLGLWLDIHGRREVLDQSPALVAQLTGDRSSPESSDPADFRSPEDREWDVCLRPYPGLRGRNEKLHKVTILGISNPIMTWKPRCGTVLPGDQVVFELEGHILLVDLITERVALLAMGRGPIVLLPPGARSATRPATGPARP